MTEFIECRQWLQNADERACLESAIRGFVNSTGSDEGALLLPVDGGKQLEFTLCCTRSGINTMLTGQRVPVTEGVVGKALQSGEGQIGAPIFKNLIQAEFDKADFGNPTSIIAVPLVFGGIRMGAMTLATFNPDHKFSANEVTQYSAFANLVGLMLYKQYVLIELSGQLAAADSPDIKTRLHNAVGKIVTQSPGRIEGTIRILETIAELK